MQHIFLRCKHCGKTYTYCTYGNGPKYGTEFGCSMDYCADCQMAINDALAKIAVRYVKKYQFVTDESEIVRLEQIFEDEKAKFYTKNNTISVTLMIPDRGFEDIEKCYIDWVEYNKCVEENGRVLYEVAVEWDTVEEKFTGKKYEEPGIDRTKYIPVTQLKIPKIIAPQKMSPPKGQVFFMEPDWDYTWEVVTNKDKDRTEE